MEQDSQPEAYLVYVWIREIHLMLWRRFLVRSDSFIENNGQLGTTIGVSSRNNFLLPISGAIWLDPDDFCAKTVSAHEVVT